MKLGLLGPTDDSKRRPGDVSFANWRNGRGLAIDVAVICPLAASHLHQEEPCEIYAERQKHKRYDAGFKGSRYEFAAMVFETSGAVNSEGNDIVKQLIQARVRWKLLVCWPHSCCIQTSVAQAILNRDYDEVR